ncbi:MAG TPA: heme lyase CcmF/NrfE family subunit [Pelomicrobium sp.]|nr:heme lyase CcmF/NrfE family subunit [Pelomicrobium sp.]
MIPEFGHFALIVALFIALMLGLLPMVGAARGVPAFVAFARPAAQGQFVFVAIAFAALMTSFVTSDFSVANVATNSNLKLPLHYRVAATWGSHEGSMLLWALMLSGWMVAVSVFSRRLPDEMVARVLAVMGLLSVGFLLFILLTSNPFQRLMPPALDGRDLNPLLQDPGMVFHPPMLYMGYVGFSVAFAFAVAALIGGRLDASWARWSRPWTIAAWVFLTLGIALGSFWAYYELGWGGWWFWDPVENASFMPWLVGAALMHSLAVTEKRGGFRAWTVLLAIGAFSLSLLGTFLVRSGVLTSVHAFATDPKRGVFILAFIVVVVGGSLGLFAWRARAMAPGPRFALLSRESLLVANNVLLVTAAGSVLLGTLYPLLLDGLGLGKISVGPPYFETIFVPLMLPMVFLMGAAPLIRWQQADARETMLRIRWPAVASFLLGLALPVATGTLGPIGALAMAAALWVVLAGFDHLADRIRGSASIREAAHRLARPSRSHYAMLTAHLGVAVFVAGVTLVKTFETDSLVKLVPGQSTEVAGYLFTFRGVVEYNGPNYLGARGTIEVARDGEAATVLLPEKRRYLSQQMPMTEAAIDYGFTRHLYAALGEPLEDGAWTVRLYHKPFVGWIWYGCLLMALGGALSLSDRRYRIPVRATAAHAQAPPSRRAAGGVHP